MANSNLPPIDELKQLLEDLRNYSRQGPTSFNRVKREVEGIVTKMSQMAGIPKEQLKDLGELISRYEQIEDAINDINTANRGSNRALADLIRKLNSYAQQSAAIVEGLEQSEGVYAKILKLLEEQTDEVKEQQTIEEKVEKTKKGNFEKLIKTKGILEQTNRILNIQISEQDRILDAIAISEGSYSELLGYLEGMGESASKLLDTITSQSDVYDDNVDAVKQLVDNTKLSLMLQKQQYYIHLKYNDILEDSKRDVRDMYTKYAMISNLIPVIGQRLSKAFMRANAIAEEALDTAYNTFLETGNIFESANQGLNVLTRGLGGIGTAFTAFALIMAGVYKLFKGIDQKVGEIAERTGLSADQSYILYKNSLQTQTAYANQYSSLEDILSIQSQLVSETGKQLNYTESLIGKVSDMSVVFGYSADTAGKLHNTFLQLAGAMPMKDAEELSTKMQYMLGSMAEANGIAPGIVAKDLVDNSEFVARNFAGMPERAMRAAVEVRKLGYSLAQAAKVSEHLFDIQGSLTSQMEASVALGRLVDMNAARRYALEGKTGKMMEEVSKQVGSYAEFTEMTVPQRILLAKAAGMEVSELQRSLYIQKELGHLSTEEREKIANNLKDVEGITDMSADQLKIASKQVNKTKEFDNAIQKIKMALVESILPIAETLVPLFGTLAKIIGVLLFPLKVMKFVFESMSFVVRFLADSLNEITGGAIGSFFSSIHQTLIGWDNTISNLSSNTNNWIKGLVGGIGLVMVAFKPLRSMLFSILNPKTYVKGFSKLGGLLGTLGKKGKDGKTGGSSSYLSSILSNTKLGKLFSGTKIGKLVGDTIDSGGLADSAKSQLDVLIEIRDLIKDCCPGSIGSGIEETMTQLLDDKGRPISKDSKGVTERTRPTRPSGRDIADSPTTGRRRTAPRARVRARSAYRGAMRGARRLGGRGLGLIGAASTASSIIPKGSLSRIAGASKGLFSKVADAGKGLFSKIGKGSMGLMGGTGGLTGILGRGAGKGLAKGLGKTALKKIPGVGLVMGAISSIERFTEGDILGGVGEALSGIASTLPGIGTAASLAIDGALMAKDAGMFDKKEIPTTPSQITANVPTSDPVVQSSIASVKKEAAQKETSNDMAMLNNNMRELINLNRMSVAQDKKMYIQFDNGTVREVSKIQRQTSA
jgi:hypothetical protein